MDDYVPSDDGTIDYTHFEVTLCHGTVANSGVQDMTLNGLVFYVGQDAPNAWDASYSNMCKVK